MSWTPTTWVLFFVAYATAVVSSADRSQLYRRVAGHRLGVTTLAQYEVKTRAACPTRCLEYPDCRGADLQIANTGVADRFVCSLNGGLARDPESGLVADPDYEYYDILTEGLASPYAACVENSCYYVDTTLTSWPDANHTCTGRGGHLVYVTSQTEADLMQQIMMARETTTTINGYWIGGTRLSDTEPFFWLDGTLMTSQLDEFHTSFIGSELCAAYYRLLSSFRWYDSDCASDNLYSFICEEPIIG